jgi:hypothetical protein
MDFGVFLAQRNFQYWEMLWISGRYNMVMSKLYDETSLLNPFRLKEAIHFIHRIQYNFDEMGG